MSPCSAIPVPEPTPTSQPFWDAAREHRLIIQSCTNCGQSRFYPAEGCHRCGSLDAAWRPHDGRGQIYSWTVVRKTVDPAWQQRVPYIPVVVELEGLTGVLVPGILVDVAPDAVQAGMSVSIWFEDVPGEASLIRWRPASRETEGLCGEVQRPQ